MPREVTENISNPNSDYQGTTFRVPGSAKIRRKDLPVFTRLLSAMLDAGMPIVQVLQTLEEESQSKAFMTVVKDLRARIEGGESMSEAISHYPTLFDDLYVSMVEAGEAGGVLPDITARVAVYLEDSARLRRKIISAMMYPAMVCVMTGVLTTIMMVFIVPSFADIYADFGADLPAPTQMLVNISGIMRKYFLLITLAAVALGILFYQYKRTEGGAYQLDKMKLNLPVFGPLVRKISLARFSSTFSELVHSGVPILRSVEIVATAVGNKVLGSILVEARGELEAGKSLSAALQPHTEYPRMLIQMLSAGEKSGKVDEMLGKISDLYEDEVNTAISGLTSLIEPLLIVFLGVVIGAIVICMFLPIFRMSDIVSM